MTPTRRRMTKKRAHIRFLPFTLLGFIAATILYNDVYMNQEIPQQHPHHQIQYQATPDFASLNTSSIPKRPSHVDLDRFTTCSTMKKYSGRVVDWDEENHGDDLGWNVTEMWEKLRGKRLMFVGDSLNRGQWISMVCLRSSVISADKRSMSPNSHLTIFRAEDYNATVEFLWAPLLVDSNSDDPVNQTKWCGEKNMVCEELDGVGVMALAMKTWVKWVHSGVDPLKKRQTAPLPFSNCYSESSPIKLESYWGSGSDLTTMRMVRKVLPSLGSKLTVLNITQLSEYRKHGYPPEVLGDAEPGSVVEAGIRLRLYTLVLA
ncbi:trichome birefringence-like 35-like protein, partial [Drosera capensis]